MIVMSITFAYQLRTVVSFLYDYWLVKFEGGKYPLGDSG